MNYQQSAANHIGYKVSIKGIPHIIEALSDTKMGKLANGHEVPMLVATATNGTESYIEPCDAQALFKTGEVKGLEMLIDAVSKKAGRTAGKTTATASPRGGKSKKDQALGIFNKAVASGKTREWALAQFVSKVGLTPAGAVNYYQHCRTDWS